MLRSRRVTARVAVAFAAALAVAVALPALPSAASSPGVSDGGVIASAVPFKYTPNFGNGAVKALVQVGSRMVVGGTFTTVAPVTTAGAGVATTRSYLMAFNPATGVIDTGFAPAVNGEVDTIVPTADGTGVYVAGMFTTAGGVATRLALFNLSTGQRVTTFNPSLNGPVGDLALAGNRLLIAGTFTIVKSQTHDGLASVNATTGAVDPYLNIQLTGHHNYGRVAGSANARVGATAIAVSPDGTRAIVDGNFITAADGTGTYARDQILSVNLGRASATVDLNWNTDAYTNACYSWAYDSFVRDIGWSPDGSYFVVTATGGYNNSTFQNCDSASRFDAASTGLAVAPKWVNFTGTDSVYSVAVTSSAVYIGGHFRWLNNPYGQDSPAAGAVPRPGLAALEPINGLPISWNPGRNPRGHGAEVVYATATGVWVGSDTDQIGNYSYKHQKLAFFPLAGGKAAAAENTGNSGTVFTAGSRPSAATSNVLYRVNAAGPAIQSTDTGPDWAADTSSAPSSLHSPNSNTAGFSAITNVSSVLPAYVPKALFTSERWDGGSNGDNNEMVWTFPVPANDTITVNLFFANRCSCTSAVGSRKFDININGAVVASNYDVVADVGDQTATMKSFTATADGNGNVTVEFDHEVENPLVNGIEIVDASQPATTTTALNTFSANSFDATTGTGSTAIIQPPTGGGIDWTSLRGAFVLNGRLWYGTEDGHFYYRTWNGSNTFGPAMLVDPYNDPYWSPIQTGSGQVYRGTATSFYSEIPNITGMFYANRTIYYALANDNRLYSRAFSPDTATSSVTTQVTGGIISPVELVVTDSLTSATVPDFTNAGGMFLANGSLWYADRTTGQLYQASWSGGTATSAGVLDASATGYWAARAVFVAPS